MSAGGAPERKEGAIAGEQTRGEEDGIWVASDDALQRLPSVLDTGLDTHDEAMVHGHYKRIAALLIKEPGETQIGPTHATLEHFSWLLHSLTSTAVKLHCPQAYAQRHHTLKAAPPP
jgi:hypothetical protein